jgi:hypothetical protein
MIATAISESIRGCASDSFRRTGNDYEFRHDETAIVQSLLCIDLTRAAAEAPSSESP